MADRAHAQKKVSNKYLVTDIVSKVNLTETNDIVGYRR